MSRMGHASPRAALIYQHATQDRDAAIAAALSQLIVEDSKKTREAKAAVVALRTGAGAAP